MTRRGYAPPDSDIYHGVRGGRVKCGSTTIDDYDEIRPIAELNIETDRHPCGNCWRSNGLNERIASIGIENDA